MKKKQKKRVDEYLEAYDFRHLDMNGLFEMNAADVALLKKHHEAASRYLRPYREVLRFFTQAAYASKYDLPTDQDGIAIAVTAREMLETIKVMRLLLPTVKPYLSAARRSEIKQTLTEWERFAKPFGGLLQSLDVNFEEQDDKREMSEGSETVI